MRRPLVDVSMFRFDLRRFGLRVAITNQIYPHGR